MTVTPPDPQAPPDPAATAAAWEAAGRRTSVHGHTVWYRRVRAAAPSGAPPLLALHGFPTCSYDWAPVLEALSTDRDVVLLDVLGFGLSDKPDLRYSLRLQADAVEAVAAAVGLSHCDLLTHDMGDSIGGEVLARELDGELAFTVGRRVLSNGSIYIDQAQLTLGQQLLLGLPDEANDLVGADGGAGFRSGVAATFAPDSPVDEHDLHVLWLLASRAGGSALLPRTIRYIEDRRAEERRFTGAIEAHPAPLGVVWGALDPVAVVSMTDTLVAARPGTPVTVLDDVGHYPMLEAPDRFAAAVRAHLEGEVP